MNEAIRELADTWDERAKKIRLNAAGCRQPVTLEDMMVNRAVAFEESAQELRAALLHAGEVPQPSEHLAFVAVMNALDIHMPPDGESLLNELRQIAATAGYPWKGALPPVQTERTTS